jgi:Ca2+-binding RTX toxin-like protein
LDADVSARSFFMAKIKGNKKANKLKGTKGPDVIAGLGGNDVLRGKAGDDRLKGGAGDDILDGGAGSDIMKGGAGNDRFVAGEGGDLYDGGAGIDLVDFTANPLGVTVELLLMTDTFGGLQRAYRSIENIDGSAYGDILEGDGAANHFRGLGGNDSLRGGAGDDTLDGGNGNDVLEGGSGADALIGGSGYDTVTYHRENSGVSVYLFGAANGGAAAGDTLSGIEQVTGTLYADVIQGDDLANRLNGLNGADVLNGRGGNDVLDGGDGADILDGGANNDIIYAADETGLFNDIIVGGSGNDTVDYFGAASGVAVDLTANTSGGAAAGDSYTSLENVNGYYYDDTLRPGPNGRAFGDRGADTIYDSTGTELLRGGRGADILSDIQFGEDGLRDIFVLESYGDGTFDTILGFTTASGAAADLFWLPKSMFGGLSANAEGVLASGYFINAANNHAATAAHAQLIYQQDTASIWYDADGTGGGAAVKVAVLAPGPVSLAGGHFLLVDV